MAYEIYTYGAGDYLVQTFTSVKLFLGSNDFVTFARLAGALGVLWVLITAAFGKYAPDFKYFLRFAFVYMALLVPKADVAIVDRVGPIVAGPVVVNNVPFGIAIFGAITTSIGDSLARLYDTYITIPGDQKYSQHGMLFGSSLITNGLQMDVPDTDFAHNLNNWLTKCGFWQLSRRIISEDQLAKTNDLWALLKANASILRFVEWSTPGPTGDFLWTCRDAAVDLDNRWGSQITDATNVLGKSVWPKFSTVVAAASVSAALPGTYSYFTNASSSASGLLQQQIMINAVKRSLQNYASSADASAAAINIAQTQAEAAQRTTYTVVGNMAAKFLPIFKHVLEGIVYGAFPIVAFALLLPATGTVFTQYLKILVWLQLLAPFYAIINSIMTWYGKYHSTAAAMLPNGTTYSLSLQTSNSLLAANADVIATAGYLTVVISAMAWMIVQAGAVSGTALVSGLLGPMQSAAGQFGAAASGGNFSMGQMSMDNMRMNTIDANKMDANASVRSGALMAQLSDGSTATVTPGGSTIVSQALSALKFDPGARQAMSRAMKDTLEGGESAAAGALANYAVTGSAALTKALGFGASNSKGSTAGVHHGLGQDLSKIWSSGNTITSLKNWAKENGVGTSEAVAIMTAAQASLSLGKGVSPVAIQAIAGITQTGEARATELYKAAVAFNQQHDFGSKVNQTSKAAWDATFDTKTGTVREGSSDLRSAIENTQRASEEFKSAHERYARASRQFSAARENGYTVSEKDTQDFVNWLGGRVGNAAALSMITSSTTGDGRLGEYAALFAKERAEQALSAGGLRATNEVTSDELYRNLPGANIVQNVAADGQANSPTISEVTKGAGSNNNVVVAAVQSGSGVTPGAPVESHVPRGVGKRQDEYNKELNAGNGSVSGDGRGTTTDVSDAIVHPELLQRASKISVLGKLDEAVDKLDEAVDKGVNDATKWGRGGVDLTEDPDDRIHGNTPRKPKTK